MRWADWPVLRPGERRNAGSEREAVLLALVRAGVLQCDGGRVAGDPEWPTRVIWRRVPEPFGRVTRQESRLRLAAGLLALAVLVLIGRRP